MRGKMRNTFYNNRTWRSLPSFSVLLFVLVNYLVSEVSTSEPPTNATNIFIENAGNITHRNSRQLLSLFKNVVNKYQPENGDGQKTDLVGKLGTLATSFVGNLIANGIKTNLGSSNPSPTQYFQEPSYDQQHHSLPPTNPNEYMHYLLMNSQANQHTSVPHYQQQQHQKYESTSDLIKKYQLFSSLQQGTSVNGDDNVAAGTSSSIVSTGNQILSKLAFGKIFDDLDIENVSNFLSFGSFEKMMEKVNKFDKLKCIPRLLCQMVAKREEDARTTTTTSKPEKQNRRKSDFEEKEEDEGSSEVKEKQERESITPESQIKANTTQNNNSGEKHEESVKEEESKEEESKEDEDDEEEDDEDDDSDEKVYEVIKGGQRGQSSKPEGRREGRIFKINGADTALEQFVKFLEIMQLKDWSLYPYVNGAYQGHQVSRSEDCAYRFPSCPFSDDQLVYYFNNYNGGFFQSI